MKTIQEKKAPLNFDIISLNNTDNFFTARYAIFLHLESLKEYLIFHDLNYVLKNDEEIIFLF